MSSFSVFFSFSCVLVKRYFKPKVDKAARPGSSRGHASAARTDLPDPRTDRISVPRLLHLKSCRMDARCTTRFKTEQFYYRATQSSWRAQMSVRKCCVLFFFWLVFLYPLSTLYCALKCESILKIKISTNYAFTRLRNGPCNPNLLSILRNLFFATIISFILFLLLWYHLTP